MNKSLIAASVLMAMGLATTATTSQALTITVTTMEFYDANGNPQFFGGGLNTSVVGTLNDLATGSMNSGPTPFFGTPWTATQQMWIDGNDAGVSTTQQNWSGSSPQGAFNYDFWLTGNQVAAGIYFTWGAASGIAVLQVFDCPDGVGGACVGVDKDWAHAVPGSEMANGPFTGQHATFKGTTADVMPTIVPVPAAVWLFGSGLLGLVGVARRKKA